MIPAFLYQYLYLFVVLLLTVHYLNDFKLSTIRNIYSANNTSSLAGGLVLTAFLTLIIGNRPLDFVFADTMAYAELYSAVQGNAFFFDWGAQNVIFDNLLIWFASAGLPISLFFTIIAAIYFGCIFWACHKLFPNAPMLSYVVYLGAFSTFSYGTNGIKAGAAASIFIMALGYMDKKVLCAALMLVSFGFHHSMIMPIAAFVLTIFFKNPKWYYYGWFVCLLLAVLHVSYFQTLFAGMADERGVSYLVGGDGAYITGFRLDFILYSAAPVIMGYVFEVKHKVRLSMTYSTLIHFYLTTNAIWMLCMYASFTNRIAYLSWFVYPIVVIYPFLDKLNSDSKRYAKLRKAVIYHLGFTLFMNIIYYGILRPV